MANPADLPFNGVHVTEQALAEGSPAGWDVESTLWFVWSFKLVRCEGPIAKGWNVAG
jgi:hypothetical protein